MSDKALGSLASGNSYHKLRSLEVSGGFLDNARLEFHGNLNCIIGGRGTGKTTAIELIRYALGEMPDPKKSPDLARQLEKLISGNLETGKINLSIQTKDGMQYTANRSYNAQAVITDSYGTPVPITLDRGMIFKAEIYSQNQIEEIATNPLFQLELIDNFKEEEIKTINQEISRLIRELSANAGEIIDLRKHLDELQEGISEIPVLKEKLKPLQQITGEEAEKTNQQHQLKSLRDQESRSLLILENIFTQNRSVLDNFSRDYKQKLKGTINPELLSGPNGEVFQNLKTKLQSLISQIDNSLSEAMACFEEAISTIQENKTELSQIHIPQEKAYRDLLDKSQADQHKSREREQIQSHLNELLIQEAELNQRKADLGQKETKRREMINRLSEFYDQRYQLRRAVADKINQNLMPAIRVKIKQAGNKERYRELLVESLKGSGTTYRPLSESIANRIDPASLFNLVQSDAANQLAEMLNINSDRAQKLINSLKNTKEIYNLQVVELYDKPSIELADGEEYKDSTILSTGQKCTTILPIILLESEKPLIIDQPEDNLDNAFITETVIESIRKTKSRRQLIFVTHNPNIPVIGDAERVFVLNSTGKKAFLETQGTVDEVQEHIKKLMEGGQKAFEQRMRRYGY